MNFTMASPDDVIFILFLIWFYFIVFFLYYFFKRCIWNELGLSLKWMSPVPGFFFFLNIELSTLTVKNAAKINWFIFYNLKNDAIIIFALKVNGLCNHKKGVYTLLLPSLLSCLSQHHFLEKERNEKKMSLFLFISVFRFFFFSSINLLLLLLFFLSSFFF